MLRIHRSEWFDHYLLVFKVALAVSVGAECRSPGVRCRNRRVRRCGTFLLLQPTIGFYHNRTDQRTQHRLRGGGADAHVTVAACDVTEYLMMYAVEA